MIYLNHYTYNNIYYISKSTNLHSYIIIKNKSRISSEYHSCFSSSYCVCNSCLYYKQKFEQFISFSGKSLNQKISKCNSSYFINLIIKEILE
jgi:hypothetical protein